MKFFFFDKIANNITASYLHHIKVLKRNPFLKPYVTAGELDDNHPGCVYPAYELSDAVMVRTEASKNLHRANVI